MPQLLPDWMSELPIQQQAVLVLALRGPDGYYKNHPCKDLLRAYRSFVLVSARVGRMLHIGERIGTFMDLTKFGDILLWNDVVDAWFSTFDELPIHYQGHLMHGIQILGYKHPHDFVRSRWLAVYVRWCQALHVIPEDEEAMDARLCDWNQKYFDLEEDSADAA